jgi:uncharacterized protein DUF5681
MAKDNEDKSQGNYVVGYGKPPVRTRFQKGQSGNPAGRRKGSLNFSTVLLATLNEKVVVIEKGRRKQISKLEALVKQLVHKAAGGDLRALSQVAMLTLNIEQNAEREPDPGVVVNELDKKMILSILKQYDQSTKE